MSYLEIGTPPNAGEFSRTVITLFGRGAAPDQGGLLSGDDPTQFNSSDPLRIWIIQVGVIIMMTQVLSLGLRKMRQPRVIAEVLGGIILGPTAFGRIPGFTKHIFPSASLSYLSLVANIGLCLFLFLVGLEIDASIIKRNVKLSATIALAGIALPFGLGAALSVPLYHHFISSTIKFTNFMLFTGVAYSITAFPVLCRILTELQLLDTTVGIVVLSAGVGNDIVGWTLLALSVALVNGGAGITALYILLVCVAWALLLLFVGRWLLLRLARSTGSVNNGPTMFFMTITMLLLFGSAFMTDIIGVHAIFGAFIVGIIVPREGELNIALTEKLEDMVSIVFLPLYFTLSGLSTNLGLLDNGVTWAFTIAIVCLSFFGKFGGCTIAARSAGFKWREASAIGSLMSCKGLVELIVLNVGLSAGILTQRVFSMFVFEALVLTFMTTPLVTTLYPPDKRTRAMGAGANMQSIHDGTIESVHHRNSDDDSELRLITKSRLTVVLDKIEHLPSLMALTQLLHPDTMTGAEATTTSIAKNAGLAPSPLDTTTLGTPGLTTEGGEVNSHDPSSQSLLPTTTTTSTPSRSVSVSVSVDALRLIELSDRTSAVMKSSTSDTLLHVDPLLGIYRMFAELQGLPVSTHLSIVSYDDLAHSVVDHAKNAFSDLIVLPWLAPYTGGGGAHHHQHHVPTAAAEASGATHEAAPARPHTSGVTGSPFDALFRGFPADKSMDALHLHFLRNVFAHSTTDVALFVDRGTRELHTSMTSASTKTHCILPFFGGPDDRLALEFVVQLCARREMTATVIRIRKQDPGQDEAESLQLPEEAHHVEKEQLTGPPRHLTITSVTGGGGGGAGGLGTVFADTVYGHATTQTRMQSETADQIVWERYASADRNKAATASSSVDQQLAQALARIEFQELATPEPLHAITRQAIAREQQQDVQGKLFIIVGRSRRLAVEDHTQELAQMVSKATAAAAAGNATGGGPIQSDMKKMMGDVGSAFVVAGCRAGIVVLQAGKGA